MLGLLAARARARSTSLRSLGRRLSPPQVAELSEIVKAANEELAIALSGSYELRAGAVA